jgi:hypothetical protein
VNYCTPFIIACQVFLGYIIYMKIMILAVLMAILQASSPVPRKTAETKTGKSNNINQNAKGKEYKASSPQAIVNNSYAMSDAPSTGDNRQVGKYPQTNINSTDWGILLFTGLLVAVGFLQWFTLKKQASLMAGSIHVDGVRVAGLIEGQTPIFFVRVVNSGMTARQVFTVIEIEISGVVVAKYKESVPMIVPAHGKRDFFINSGIVVSYSFLQELSGDTLRVRGRIAWGNGKKNTEEYCYKYNPCPLSEIPKKFPQFVPCDFSTERVISVSIRM